RAVRPRAGCARPPRLPRRAEPPRRRAPHRDRQAVPGPRRLRPPLARSGREAARPAPQAEPGGEGPQHTVFSGRARCRQRRARSLVGIAAERLLDAVRRRLDTGPAETTRTARASRARTPLGAALL